MTTKWFCDICKREQDNAGDLKQMTIKAYSTDSNKRDVYANPTIDLIATLKFDICQKCQTKNEIMLRQEIEQMTNLFEASK